MPGIQHDENIKKLIKSMEEKVSCLYDSTKCEIFNIGLFETDQIREKMCEVSGMEKKKSDALIISKKMSILYLGEAKSNSDFTTDGDKLFTRNIEQLKTYIAWLTQQTSFKKKYLIYAVPGFQCYKATTRSCLKKYIRRFDKNSTIYFEVI